MQEEKQAAPVGFGCELSCDFGFTNRELNGNVAGMRWTSRGDGEQRAYGFTFMMRPTAW